MQDRYPAEKRGDLQSAANLQDCFAGIIAVALIAVFEIGCECHWRGSPPRVPVSDAGDFIAIACFRDWFIIRLVPADFIRVIGIWPGSHDL
jgi:acyl-[acyl-carrier-protein]-phospholipid O-acyltransferase / long-chain-fatty-acid--[acyl-carrier-protein] ligase